MEIDEGKKPSAAWFLPCGAVNLKVDINMKSLKMPIESHTGNGDVVPAVIFVGTSVHRFNQCNDSVPLSWLLFSVCNCAKWKVVNGT